MTTKKLLKLNGYSGIFKLIVEVIVLVFFTWTFIQVRDIPATYISRLEVTQIKTEIKTDVEHLIEPMRKQITQIYNHLLGEKK